MNFRRPERRSFDARIEIAPLIDVVFLLLIFFLLTTSFVQHRTLGLELPATRGPRAEAPKEALLLVLEADGTIRHQGRPLDAGALGGLLQEAAAATPPRAVVLRADARVTHGAVVHLLDRIQHAGLHHVVIDSRALPASGP